MYGDRPFEDNIIREVDSKVYEHCKEHGWDSASLGYIAGQLLMTAINGRSKECNDFIDSVLTSHRTLQQSFTGNIILAFITKVASMDERCFDGRNECMKRFCDMLKKAIDESDFSGVTGLPMI